MNFHVHVVVCSPYYFRPKKLSSTIIGVHINRQFFGWFQLIHHFYLVYFTDATSLNAWIIPALPWKQFVPQNKIWFLLAWNENYRFCPGRLSIVLFCCCIFFLFNYLLYNSIRGVYLSLYYVQLGYAYLFVCVRNTIVTCNTNQWIDP